MKPEGWLLLIASWGVVSLWAGWCIYRVLSSRKHWTRPQEEIEKLHHGEFREG